MKEFSLRLRTSDAFRGAAIEENLAGPILVDIAFLGLFLPPTWGS